MEVTLQYMETGQVKPLILSWHMENLFRYFNEETHYAIFNQQKLEKNKNCNNYGIIRGSNILIVPKSHYNEEEATNLQTKETSDTQNEESVDKKINRIYVKGGYINKKFRVLVDCASKQSIISSSLLELFQIEGNNIVRIPLKLGKHEFVEEFFVCKMRANIITLGLDFMNKRDVTLDFRKGEIVTAKGVIKFISPDEIGSYKTVINKEREVIDICTMISSNPALEKAVHGRVHLLRIAITKCNDQLKLLRNNTGETIETGTSYTFDNYDKIILEQLADNLLLRRVLRKCGIYICKEEMKVYFLGYPGIIEFFSDYFVH